MPWRRLPDMETIGQAIGALALAAQQAALLRGALTSGFLAHLGTEIGVAELATRTGLDHTRVHDLCVALQAAGVLASDHPDHYRLSDTYAPVIRDGADKFFTNLLRGVELRERLIEQTFRPQGPDRYADLSEADRLTMAASSSLVPSTEFARRAMRPGADLPPAWAEAMAAGDVRALQLGCGLGGRLLTLMQLYPRLTAVAVDVEAELIRRARADAEALGSADRVRFVVDDATVFSDPEPFDMVFWSQIYFPASSREKTLATAYRSLRPGGILVAPVLPTFPAGSEGEQSINVLRLHAWDVPAPNAAEIRPELEAAGFVSVTAYGPHQTGVIAHRL